MEPKNLENKIEISNSTSAMDYEILFDFELDDSTLLLPQNQVINEDVESIGCITSKIKLRIKV